MHFFINTWTENCQKSKPKQVIISNLVEHAAKQNAQQRTIRLNKMLKMHKCAMVNRWMDLTNMKIFCHAMIVRKTYSCRMQENIWRIIIRPKHRNLQISPFCSNEGCWNIFLMFSDISGIVELVYHHEQEEEEQKWVEEYDCTTKMSAVSTLTPHQMSW